MNDAIIIAREPHTWREKRNGGRRYVGQVLRLTQKPRKTVVLAEVYGDTEEQMLERRYAVLEALKQLEKETS